jgi:pimeloyl-ACP methyl ester carboxylesterase
MRNKRQILVLTLLIILLASAAAPFFIAKSFGATTSAETGWTLTTNSRSLKAYPALQETIWQKNASMPPNGQYDKIGLHRLVNTGSSSKGVVFILPGLYGSGENTISNPPSDNFTLTENYSHPIYWANRGFEVYSVDYRMHFVPANLNASQLSFMVDWGLEQMMSDIKEAVTKTKEASGTSKIFMAGFSMGGTWVQYYAAKYWQEDLRGILLLDPASKTTFTKNSVLTNLFNLTKELDAIKIYGNWSWENPQQAYSASPLNPGYLFLIQYASQNPTAPAKWPNGTLLTPTINPNTNATWANISEWFEYRGNSGGNSNTYGGYGNNSVNLNVAAGVDRWMPNRPFRDSAAMLDWSISPYISYDFVAHIKEINVPVLGFRSALLGIPTYGPLTNGMATTDFTSIVLANYGHTDVIRGTYNARDVAQPALNWMMSHYQPPSVSAFCSVSVITGQTWYFFAHSAGTFGPNTYQWFEGNTILTGQTSMVLPITKTAAGTYVYTCKVIDAEGTTATSNTVTLTVINK